MRADLPRIAAFALALSGCVAVPTQTLTFSYSEEEYAPFKRHGDAVVWGQAFLRQQGGGVVVCAGEPVMLIPRTAYFEQAVSLARAHIQPVPANLDPRLKDAARLKVCDAQGNFRFADLPRQRWYLFSQVRWRVGDYNQGGELIAEVDTMSGGEQQVLLTDNNRI